MMTTVMHPDAFPVEIRQTWVENRVRQRNRRRTRSTIGLASSIETYVSPKFISLVRKRVMLGLFVMQV